MHALILAAGRSALSAGTTPTCLVEVGGRPLLCHQVEAARAAGAQRVTVVTGHGHARVRKLMAGEIDIVLNERYADTNSLYSFWLARHRVRGDVLVLSCDVLFPQHVLRGLLHRGSALAFDSRSGECGEHLKVSPDDGRLLAMSKDLPARDMDGENLGLLHLTHDVACAAFEAAAELLRRGSERDSLATAINVVAARHPIACVDVAGIPWVEIDHPRDLVAARKKVWPAIAKLSSRSGALPRFPKTDRLLDGTLDRGGNVRELGFSGERPVVPHFEPNPV